MEEVTTDRSEKSLLGALVCGYRHQEFAGRRAYPGECHLTWLPSRPNDQSPEPADFVAIAGRLQSEQVAGFDWNQRPTSSEFARLTKDFENLNHNALTFLRLASIRLMLRKVCNPP